MRCNESSPTVVHINTNLRWGGGEHQVLALLRGAARHGVRAVLLARPDGELFRRARVEAEGAGFRVVPFDFRTPHSPLAQWRLRRALRSIGPSILHLHDSAGAYLGIRAARRIGIPVVLHRRISSPVRSNPFSRALYTSPCIAKYVAVSEAARESLLGASVARERTIVIPSGVSTMRLQPDAVTDDPCAALGLPDGSWVGTVSSLEKKKDIETFVRAAHALAPLDPDLRFLIVGTGPEEPRLRRLVDELGLGDRVYFTGHVPDAHRFIAALSVFVFPSLREGSPGVVKEAMALGVPIVAAAAPGTDEVVDDETARVVAAGDAQGMAMAVREVLLDPRRRQRMVRMARERVEREFPIELTVARVMACYRRILGLPMPKDEPRVVPVAAGRRAATRSA